jgi:hypothetical protein
MGKFQAVEKRDIAPHVLTGERENWAIALCS